MSTQHIQLNVPLSFNQLVEVVQQLSTKEKLQLGRILWDETKEEEIDIPEYGLVTFTRPTDDRSLEYLNASANAVKIDREGTIQSTDLIFMNEAAKPFIYFSCPYLQNTDLQEALNIKDPLDTPAKVFGANNLIDIANLIKQKFGDGTKVKRTIKN